ncbi:hypothetical protein LCGC14_2473330 [marine sediment metagenome]|uniref:Lipoprotein n=1 Tax=marine sediment metagenome TaxID=412755 RepID=A0A0F9DLT7_9ZZZZ
MKKVLTIITVLLFAIGVLTGCLASVAESPLASEYAVQQGGMLFTTDEYPVAEFNNYFKITNYWWREYDEEGNTEWLRRDEDWYIIYLNILDGPITVREIKDGRIAEVVHMWEGFK